MQNPKMHKIHKSSRKITKNLVEIAVFELELKNRRMRCEVYKCMGCETWSVRVVDCRSPESGIGDTSRTSQVSAYADSADNGSYYNEAEPLPVLGTGKALYTFDGMFTYCLSVVSRLQEMMVWGYWCSGCSDGTVAMREGEELLLVEKDEGDGWTRIRRIKSGEEGFVPTTYLDCKYYPPS